jgi:hypothetical protein
MTASSFSPEDGAKDDDSAPTPYASRHFSMADMQNYYLLPAAERDKHEGDAVQGHLAEHDSESEANGEGEERHSDAMSQASFSAHSDNNSAEIPSTAVATPSTTVVVTPKGASTRKFSLRVGNLDGRHRGSSVTSALSVLTAAESRGKDAHKNARRKSSVGTLM